MTTKKRCFACKKRKPLDQFYKNRRERDGLSRPCKTCSKAFSKSWQLKNKERYLNYQAAYQKKRPGYQALVSKKARAKRLGMTLDEYERLMTSPCEICGTKPTKGHLDHDHATGRIRGLLCPGCNLGIGHFRDNPELLLKAAAYLNKHGIS